MHSVVYLNTEDFEIISCMANLIENRDMDTGEHIARTSAYVKALAEDARRDGVYADVLDDHYITLLYTLAPMHDIGKIVIPDNIRKNRASSRRRNSCRCSAIPPRAGLSFGISSAGEYRTFASDIVTGHHEHWDGTGYPEGKSGEDIPLSARIMAIADVYDALISERCYKAAMPPDEAFQIIRKEAGFHFDPKLSKVFLDHREDFRSEKRGV